MKKKKWAISGLVAGCLFMLTGCMGVTELSEDENRLIARYAAGALLNYSEEYSRKLTAKCIPIESGRPVYMASPVPSTSPAVESSPLPQAGDLTEQGGSSGEQGVTEGTDASTSNLNDIYQLKGLDFSFQGYEFCKKYPKKSSIYQILSNKEEILFVVKFKVHNTTSKSKSVNLMKRKIGYNLNADGTIFKPVISMLENGGLNFLKTKIHAGKKEEAVLIYSVPKRVNQAEHLSVYIKNGSKTAVVQVK